MRRLSILVAAFVATVFLTGGHCGNELTAPSVTPTGLPTRVPTVTPTPTQPASMVVFVVGRSAGAGFPPIDEATVIVLQGSISQDCFTRSDGACQFLHLLSGPATVTAQKGILQGSTSTVLAPGSNDVTVHLQ